MKKEKISLSVFFPAYNEEENIGASIKRALDVLGKITSNYEILVVDDGSTDRTGEIVKKFCKKNHKIRIIQHHKNRGYGIALKSGFENAKKDLIFYTDSDLQFDLNEIEKLLPHIKDNDIVIGYRINREDPIMRLVAAYIYRLIVEYLLDLRVKDPDCAFKLCRKRVIDKIRPFESVRSGDVELLVKAKKHGFRIKEFGIKHLPRTKGKSEAATLFNLIKPKIVYLTIKEILNLRNKITNI